MERGVDTAPSGLTPDSVNDILKEANRGASVSTHALSGVCTERTVYNLFGERRGPKHVRINNTAANAFETIATRVLCVKYKGSTEYTAPISPEPGFYSSKVSPIVDELLRELPRILPMTADQLYGSVVGLRKRLLYMRAGDSLSAKPLCKEDYKIYAMLKNEDLPVKLDDQGKAKPVVARNISVRGKLPRMNHELLRYTKPAEKLVYAALNRIEGVYVSKGKNSVETASMAHECWTAFNDCVAVCVDATKCDVHMHDEPQDVTLRIVRHMYPGDKLPVRILRNARKTDGLLRTRDGIIRYKVNTTQMSSGDGHTALGTQCACAPALVAYLRETVSRWRLLSNGDDNVIFVERTELGKLNDLESWFARCGMAFRVDTTAHQFEQIEYCQAHPVFNGERYVMVRNAKALERDLRTDKDCRLEKVWNAQRGANSDCGIALYSGIPVLQSVYKAMGRGAGTRRDKVTEKNGKYYMMQGMEQAPQTITEAARESFYYAFGVLPEVQREVELEFDSVVYRHSSPTPAEFATHTSILTTITSDTHVVHPPLLFGNPSPPPRLPKFVPTLA